MKMTNTNRAVLFSIIGLCVISIIYRYFPRELLVLKTTVHVDLWQEETEGLQNLIAAFEEEHPEIVVVTQVHSYQDLAIKLIEPSIDNPETKQVQSDLVLLDMDWLPNVTKSDILEPLAGFPKDNADVTMLYERSRIDGISYTIPLFSNPYIFFYNINVLKSAGFDRPPKTRDEFLSYSRALKEKQIAGIGLALAAENHSGMFSDLYSWFWNSDISFITDGEPQFSTRPVLETLRFLETASKENLISPDSFHKTEQEKIDDFCSGKTAMMITSLSNLSQIKNKVKFEWGTSSIPTAASFIGNPLFVTESFSMGIYAQSEHKEEAWKFLAFLAGAAQNAELASSFNAIPANQNAQPLSTETLPQEEKALELINAGKLLNEFDMQPGVFMAEKIIRTELQKMMSGAISPELCAEAIQKQWENI